MPRSAAMCAAAAGTASGSARGWFAQDSTNLPRRGTARSSSVFQSASAWQGWLTADSRLTSGLSQSAAIFRNIGSARSVARSRPSAKARTPSTSQ